MMQIAVVRRKLALANPAAITIHELRLGHSKKPEALAAMTAIVRGDPTTHLRCVALNEQASDCSTLHL